MIYRIHTILAQQQAFNCCIVLALFFLASCSTEELEIKNDALDIIPVNAVCIVEGRNLNSSIEVLKQRKFDEIIEDKTHLFHKIIDIERDLQKRNISILQEEVYSYSIHPLGTEFQSLLILEDKESIVENILQSNASEIDTSRYDNQRILRWNTWNISLVKVGKHLIISEAEILVKDAIRQYYATVTLPQQEDFSLALELADRSAFFNTYLQTGYLRKYMQQSIYSNLDALETFDEWIAADISLNDKFVQVKGVSSLSPENAIVSLFQNSSKTQWKAIEHLPANTSRMYSRSFKNIQEYYLDRLKYLEKRKLERQWKTMESAHDIGLTALENTLDRGFSVFWPAHASSPGILVSTEEFSAFSKVFISEDLPKDTYRGVTIYRTVPSEVLSLFFSQDIQNEQPHYLAFVDNFGYIFPSKEDLKQCLNDIISGNTLAMRPDVMELSREMLSSSDADVFVLPDAWDDILLKPVRKKNKPIIESLGLVWGQCIFKEDIGIFHLLFSAPDHVAPVAEQISGFHLKLPFPVLNKPISVYNHQTKQNQWLVQTTDYQLHLLTPEGNVAWSYACDGEILGRPQQIDMYKNGRLQILFNTSSTLYSLDILGRNVSTFPVALSAAATDGLAVFDYSFTKDYRVAVPTVKGIDMFNDLGKIIQGWKAKIWNNGVYSTPQWIQTKGKDYILAINKEGFPHLLNRRGELRKESTQKASDRMPEAATLHNADQEPTFTYLSENFDLWEITENKTLLWSAENTSITSIVKGASQYMFTTKKSCFSLSFEGEVEELFQLEPSKGVAQVSISEGQEDIMILYPEVEETYVYDLKGNLRNAIALYGNKSLSSTRNGNVIEVLAANKGGNLYQYLLQVKRTQ